MLTDVDLDPPRTLRTATQEPASTDPLVRAHRAFRDELLGAGLLVPTGLEGLYGRGETYDRVVNGVKHALMTMGRGLYPGPVSVLRFPPIFPRVAYEKTDYIASFPQLTGGVSTFKGGDREHRTLLGDRSAGLPWDHHLTAGDTMLVSAACHPAYETLSGSTVPADGLVLNVDGWCFRHEPSPDPLRQQAFDMMEFVTIGTPELTHAHRRLWVDGATALLVGLGMEPRAVAANDPFFGRAGKMLAGNQLEEELKIELVVSLYGDLDEGTALISANRHLDHFGRPFDLRTPDGATAHSACAGLGVDRIAMALLRIHGLDVTAWPAGARSLLWGETPVEVGSA